MKINIESDQSSRVVHAQDKMLDWKARADYKNWRESKVVGCFTFPSSPDDLIGFIGVWLILPLAYIVTVVRG